MDRRGVAALVSGACFVSLALIHPVASADPSDLPITGFSDIVVDEGHDRVFLSSARDGEPVVVTDADGHQQQTLPALEGAAGMVVQPDGSTLFVALPRRAAIAKVDTTDLSVDLLPTGAGTCPWTVEWAADTVWFGDKCTGPTSLNALDPQSGIVSRNLVRGVANGGFPLLAASADRPSDLLIGDGHMSPSRVYRLHVTGGSAPSATVLAEQEVGFNLTSMSYAADGQHVVVADGGVYEHQVLDADDLASLDPYRSATYPQSQAVRHDGMVALGVFGTYFPDIWIYNPGDTSATQARTYELDEPGDDLHTVLAPDGLLFGNGRLYAVTTKQGLPPYRLRVLRPGTPEPFTISVSTDSDHFPAGSTARLTVQVDPAGPGAGQPLMIYQVVQGVPHEWRTVTPDESGRVEVTVPVETLVQYRVEHRYPDGTHTPYEFTRAYSYTPWIPDTATHFTIDAPEPEPEPEPTPTVEPGDLTTTLLKARAVRTGYHIYGVGRAVQVRARQVRAKAGTPLTFRVQHRTRGGWRTATLANRTLNRSGTASLAMSRFTRAGDRIRVRTELRPAGQHRVIGAWRYARHAR